MRPQQHQPETRNSRQHTFDDASRKGFPAETIVKVYHEQYDAAFMQSAAAFLSRMGG